MVLNTNNVIRFKKYVFTWSNTNIGFVRNYKFWAFGLILETNVEKLNNPWNPDTSDLYSRACKQSVLIETC